jgi:hypothetical protein
LWFASCGKCDETNEDEQDGEHLFQVEGVHFGPFKLRGFFESRKGGIGWNSALNRGRPSPTHILWVGLHFIIKLFSEGIPHGHY